MIRLFSICFAAALAVLCGCPAGAPPTRSGGTSAGIERSAGGAAEFSYTVHNLQPGDTLWSVGRRYGVPWKAIVEENGIGDLKSLKVGQTLMIPLHRRLTAGSKVKSQNEQRSGPSVASARPTSRKTRRASADGSALGWPVAGRVVRTYGERYRGLPEPGIGIVTDADATVRAASDGRVIVCIRRARTPSEGWKKVVAIRHGSHLVSWYGQLGQVAVNEGQLVAKAQPIGKVGEVRNSNSPSLAFRLFEDERLVDPMPSLPQGRPEP